MNIPDRPVLSVKETSKLLNISLTLTYQAISRGEIPHFKVGGKIGIPTHAIRSLIGLEEKASA